MHFVAKNRSARAPPGPLLAAPAINRRRFIHMAGSAMAGGIAASTFGSRMLAAQGSGGTLRITTKGRRDHLEGELTGVEIATSAEAAIADADVVMLCTSSGTPVIDVDSLKDEVTVTSISTNVAQAHEIAPTALSRFHVFCDYRATCPLSAGEMVLAGRDHGWDAKRIVADPPELVSGRSDLPTGRRFFRSIGLGLEDVAAAALLLDVR